MGIPTTEQIYTVSLNFRKTRTLSCHELARGYLDDLLILSFGWKDKSSHFVEVAVEDVLQGHEMCEDLISEYLMIKEAPPALVFSESEESTQSLL